MPRSMTICRKISSIQNQIEDIIQMINDMGIQVMEEAPDADDLLLAETSNSTDEDAEEAAAGVLSALGRNRSYN